MRRDAAFLIVPALGFSSSVSRRSSVVLPLPFGPTSPTRSSVGDQEVQAFDDLLLIDAFAKAQRNLSNSTSRFVCRSVAAKSMPAVAVCTR